MDGKRLLSTRHYHCTCGTPVTVEIWTGWGYIAEQYVYLVDEEQVTHCPGCTRRLSMAWLGQLPSRD